jgi:hypothetical protein
MTRAGDGEALLAVRALADLGMRVARRTTSCPASWACSIASGQASYTAQPGTKELGERQEVSTRSGDGRNARRAAVQKYRRAAATAAARGAAVALSERVFRSERFRMRSNNAASTRKCTLSRATCMWLSAPPSDALCSAHTASAQCSALTCCCACVAPRRAVARAMCLRTALCVRGTLRAAEAALARGARGC